MSDKCKKKVYRLYNPYGAETLCSRNAVLDGFCKQHHPETVKARNEKLERAAVEKWQNRPTALMGKRIAELEKTLGAFEQLCPKLHPYIFGTASMPCPECKAQELEAELSSAKALLDAATREGVLAEAVSHAITVEAELETAKAAYSDLLVNSVAEIRKLQSGCDVLKVRNTELNGMCDVYEQTIDQLHKHIENLDAELKAALRRNINV